MSLRLGIIGGAVNSAVGRAHFVSSQMDGKFRIVAGAFSRHREIVELTSQMWNIAKERSYTDGIEFLENEANNLDAVAILTPTPSHSEFIFKALQLGIPVICEKAMSDRMEDACAISKLASQKNNLVRLTFTYSGYPMVREARKRIQCGSFGKVIGVQVEMPQEGFIKKGPDGNFIKPQSWRQRDNEIPTISLDLGVHIHHLIGLLTGETPISVCAVQSSKGAWPGVVDEVTCLVRYSSGFLSNIWFSKVALGNRNGLAIRVFGENGSIEWVQNLPEQLKFADQHGNVKIIDRASPDSNPVFDQDYGRFKVGHPGGFVEAFANIYSDFSDEIRGALNSDNGYIPYYYSPEFATEGLRLFEAAHISANRQAWVQL